MSKSKVTREKPTILRDPDLNYVKIEIRHTDGNARYVVTVSRTLTTVEFVAFIDLCKEALSDATSGE